MFLGRGNRVITRLVSAMLATAFILVQAPHLVRAVTEKTVVHISGDVGYQTGQNTAYIPITGQQALPDNAYVVTRQNGVADLVLPDSSVIRIAQVATVQVGAFHEPGAGENTINIYNGSFRFKVQHPAGGQANYRFVTPTSQIAVRGTEGLGTVTSAQTQVSNTQSTTPNDVSVAASRNFGAYLPVNATAKELALFLRGNEAVDPMQLAALAPEPRLLAQLQFVALAQGFTATVTTTVSVSAGVLSAGALGVAGSLSSVASAGGAAAGGASGGITAGSAGAGAGAGAAGAAAAGAAAAAAAGGIAAAAGASNGGSSSSNTQPSPTPSPTASVNIGISGERRGPQPIPGANNTAPPGRR